MFSGEYFLICIIMGCFCISLQTNVLCIIMLVFSFFLGTNVFYVLSRSVSDSVLEQLYYVLSWAFSADSSEIILNVVYTMHSHAYEYNRMWTVNASTFGMSVVCQRFYQLMPFIEFVWDVHLNYGWTISIPHMTTLVHGKIEMYSKLNNG